MCSPRVAPPRIRRPVPGERPHGISRFPKYRGRLPPTAGTQSPPGANIVGSGPQNPGLAVRCWRAILVPHARRRGVASERSCSPGTAAPKRWLSWRRACPEPASGAAGSDRCPSVNIPGLDLIFADQSCLRCIRNEGLSRVDPPALSGLAEGGDPGPLAAYHRLQNLSLHRENKQKVLLTCLLYAT